MAHDLCYTWFMIKPLQVYVEEDELQRLDSWARARGWSKSQAVRLAIRALVRSGVAPRDSALLSLSGMIADGLPADLSENFDHYLHETYVSEGRAPYRRSTKQATAKRRRP
jgi:hypothetical protein